MSKFEQQCTFTLLDKWTEYFLPIKKLVALEFTKARYE